MTNRSYGLIDNWLRHIKDVYRTHSDELDAIEDQEQRHRLMVELNVKAQVYNLCKTSIVQSSWSTGDFPFIHGWVYDVHDGILKDLGVTFNSNQALSGLYRFGV
jgi:carbonic anhydrase